MPQYKPPIEQLPDIKNHKAAVSEPKISPVVIALANWINGANISGNALYKMRQFGFVYPDHNGHLQITPSGEQALRDNHLV